MYHSTVAPGRFILSDKRQKGKYTANAGILEEVFSISLGKNTVSRLRK
jgi:hypothetical protein